MSCCRSRVTTVESKLCAFSQKYLRPATWRHMTWSYSVRTESDANDMSSRLDWWLIQRIFSVEWSLCVSCHNLEWFAGQIALTCLCSHISAFMTLSLDEITSHLLLAAVDDLLVCCKTCPSCLSLLWDLSVMSSSHLSVIAMRLVHHVIHTCLSHHSHCCSIVVNVVCKHHAVTLLSQWIKSCMESQDSTDMYSKFVVLFYNNHCLCNNCDHVWSQIARNITVMLI